MYFSRIITDLETVKYSIPIHMEKITIPKGSVIIDAYEYNGDFYCLIDNVLDKSETMEVEIMFSSLPFNATSREWTYLKYLKIKREIIGVFWKEHK